MSVSLASGDTELDVIQLDADLGAGVARVPAGDVPFRWFLGGPPTALRLGAISADRQTVQDGLLCTP